MKLSYTNSSKHWEVKRLKFISEINPSRLSEIAEDSQCVFIPMDAMNSNGTFDQSERHPLSEMKNGFTRFAKNDVIFAKITPCFENGKGALLSELESEVGFGSTEFHVLRAVKGKSIPKFLYYLTISGEFRRIGEAFMQGVAGQKRVTSSFVKNYILAIPTADEQETIVNHLDQKVIQIYDLLSKKERMIELLKEERVAVINHAVTRGLDPKSELQDTGIEWLGRGPKHWGTKKLKFNTLIRFSNVNKKIEEGELPVRLCNYVDVYYNDSITDDLNFMEATATPEEIRKFKLKISDVLVTKDSEEWSDIAVPAYVATESPDLICGYHLAQIRPDLDVMNGKFLFWLLSANCINYQFKIEASGVTRFGLSNYALGNAKVACPPTKEQEKIASFLDKKIDQIDGQIGRAERSIELLKEYRTALISEAVTGKIDLKEMAHAE